MLALSREDVRRLVPMADAVELMKVAFAELSAGKAVSPIRTVIPVTEFQGDALFMPAHVPAAGALGVKVVNVFRQNPQKGLPLIHAVVVLADPETGQPLAILDGSYLTALRTGAVSGAATDLLARPESKTLVVIGTGVQGVTQAAAVCAVRPIERIIGVDMQEASLARYKEAIGRDWPELVGPAGDIHGRRNRGGGGYRLYRYDLAHAGVRRRPDPARNPHQRRRRLHP